jgi:non-specific serine/threonine protein kinase
MLLQRGAAGDRERASAELAADVTYWRRTGSRWMVDRMRERAATWGLAFPEIPEESTRARTLTRREREVAALVAEGLTNKQIAERLTLSVRTAESHVEQIRSKLGFRTRTQIATWATEQLGVARSV